MTVAERAGPPTRNPLLDAALDYAARGWPVIPIEPRGKRPLIKNWPARASTDAEQVREWFEHWPEANVGLLTGQRSDIVVLDVDGSEGDRALVDMGATVPTLTALTSRGRHLYFEHPGPPVRNRAAIRPGLDLRGDGGYVVAPPSVHETGAVYTWDDDHAMGLSLRPARFPARLREALDERTPRARPSSQGRIVEGERNVRLTQLAGSLAASAAGYDDLVDRLRILNADRCAPPLPGCEVETIARSIWSRERKARRNNRRARRRISLTQPTIATTIHWCELHIDEPQDLASLGFLLDLVRLIHAKADMPIKTGHRRMRTAWVAAGEAEIATRYLCNRWGCSRARVRRMLDRWQQLRLLFLLEPQRGRKQRRVRLTEGWAAADVAPANLRASRSTNLPTRLNSCAATRTHARRATAGDNLGRRVAATITSMGDGGDREVWGRTWVPIGPHLEVSA